MASKESLLNLTNRMDFKINKMKKFLVTMVLFVSVFAQSQDMDNLKLEKILYVMSDSIQGSTGNWQFMIEGTILFCVTDETNNRMRIISPIIEEQKISIEEQKVLLEANFHSALDARFAYSNDFLWSAYIHPLRELNKEQVIDAISQVYTLALTYGTTYNSTGLSFPNSKNENSEKEKMKELKLQKKNKT